MNQKSISCYSAAARRECTRLLHINRLFFTAFIMIASAVTFFSCNHSPGATGTVTITVKGDQGVTVNDPKTIPVSKGTKWADLKNRVKVTFKPDYELDSWKLGSATGTGITDTTVFTSNTTVFAVSKKKGGGGADQSGQKEQPQNPGYKEKKPIYPQNKPDEKHKPGEPDQSEQPNQPGQQNQPEQPNRPEQPNQPEQPPQSEITITIMVDERLETKSGNTEKVKSGKWASVKEKVAAHVQLKSDWSQDDYGIYEWRKGSEDGAPLTDDEVLSGDTTVYVVSNFRKFEIKGGKLIKLLDNEKIKGTVYIPSTVTEIGNEVFNGRENLRKVIIGDSVTTLGESVFAACNHLETVVLSKNLTQLNTGMFEECSALTAITIPSKVISIAERVFEGCTAATVTLPENIAEIKQAAFGTEETNFCKQVQIKDGTHFDRIKGLVTGSGYPEDRIKKY
nr:leucine-rich repeat domain-containing protein [uncultured Treponema sp.]